MTSMKNELEPAFTRWAQRLKKGIKKEVRTSCAAFNLVRYIHAHTHHDIFWFC